MSIEDRLAHARLEFRKFRIPHPHVARIAAELDVLRKVGQASRREWEAKGRRGARIPQKFLAVIGPSQTGKSTSIQNYLETVVAAEGHDDQTEPVLHVTMSAKATTKSLGQDILEAYLDTDFDKGNARSLLRRASTQVESANTDVLVLDEIHHLIDNDEKGTTAWSVTETIKKMLIRGACPFVIMGTERARPLLLNNPQFKGRTYAPLFIEPLDLARPAERKTFIEHCAGFDLKLVEHGIFPKPSGLVRGAIPAVLYDISQGVIGTASAVFEVAAENAIRAGRSAISLDDISDAIDGWAIPLQFTDYNPITQGLREIRPRRQT
ncbi:MAG: ATP-binding protein [Parafilimonas terrae]|nr:ATP-binding protein [Parafilimonas terrae]